MRNLFIAWPLILCVSCDSTIHVSDRLVSGELSVDRKLSRETIEIHQGFGGEGYGQHRLSYTLNPADELEISYWIMSREKPVASQTFRIASQQARRLRGELWRLRPDALSRDWISNWAARPLGCTRQGPHDLGEIWVSFYADQNHDSGASFELPYKRSCNTLAAQEARHLLIEALEVFPKSRIASEFEKARLRDGSQANTSLSDTPIPSLNNLASQ
jgi:hypothetical protein